MLHVLEEHKANGTVWVSYIKIKDEDPESQLCWGYVQY